MAKLIYSAITSLDGYSSDANGNFDWATDLAKRPTMMHLFPGAPSEGRGREGAQSCRMG
jgi:hypothetical protein